MALKDSQVVNMVRVGDRIWYVEKVKFHPDGSVKSVTFFQAESTGGRVVYQQQKDGSWIIAKGIQPANGDDAKLREFCVKDASKLRYQK